jgi:hypothetical protein
MSVLSPKPRRGPFWRIRRARGGRGALAALACSTILGTPPASRADESGTSFWQPGAYDDGAAIASLGWSVAVAPYHSSAFAGSNVTAARLVRTGALDSTALGDLSATSRSFENIVGLAPSYGFDLPALGLKAAVSVGVLVGKNSVSETGAVVGRSGSSGLGSNFSVGDSVEGFGDLAPQATLFWASGVNNLMAYVTGNAPVGDYDARRLSNLGIGHGAFDGGLGYTYQNKSDKLEFSAVAGFTYNQSNMFTAYRSGVDFHLDLGASTYLNDSVAVGPVAYLYDQIGCDGGAGDKFGCFRSRVAAAGARVAYNFTVSAAQVSLALKGYGEFAAQNRPAGWNLRLALTVSQ